MRLGRLALTATALTVSLSNQAQQPPQAPTLKVYSRETVVDITVTDAHGNPIPGLTQSDFAILEDGKPQSIRSFHETHRDTTATSAQLPKLPPGVYTNLRPAPAAGAVNILLLDDLNVAPSDQIVSRKEAERYIRTMPSGTQFALLRLGNGLQILQGFTSDADTLIAAMTDNKNSLLPPGSIIATTSCPNDLQNETTLEALREIAALVAGTKGRKDLIWFSDGIKQITDPQWRPSCQPDYTPEFHKATELLAASQVAVYSIDPRGLQPQYGLGGIKIIADHQSMDSVAEATGGGAYYNTNDLTAAVAKSVDSGASYYTLSYVPPGLQYDGRHHTIKIQVDRPDLQLAYREDYYAEDPSKIAHNPVPTLAATAPEANTVSASMARFAPPATQLLFDVKVVRTTAPPRPTDPAVIGFPVAALKGRPLLRYDLLYVLPAEQIAFAESPFQTRMGSLEFIIVASDVFGSPITSISRTLPLTLTADEYAEFLTTPFRFFQQIDLPPGQLFLRVGIHDTTSNKIGTLEIPLTVPKNLTQRTTLQPTPTPTPTPK